MASLGHRYMGGKEVNNRLSVIDVCYSLNQQQSRDNESQIARSSQSEDKLVAE